MKYKNIIYIIVDAFCYNNLNMKVGSKPITPFLNKLSSKSTNFTQLYSQAPYTEASQITLLSGENTLENGGYLLGNKTIKTPMFQTFQQKGYKTLFSYSPYVYSKEYLRNVDKYYYTRLYRIEPLFLYRFNYYREKLSNEKTLTEAEYKICILLLEEALDTWILQCQQLLDNAEEIKVIKDKIADEVNIADILEKLETERNKFKENCTSYLHNILLNSEKHILLKLNKEFNKTKQLPHRSDLIKLYSEKMDTYQYKFTKIAKKQHIDFKYLLATLLNDKDKKRGWQNFRNLLHSYLNFYNNTPLSSYLNKIDEEAKIEISMKELFDIFEHDILTYDKNNENYFSYIHVQDFHLPSVFHTFDSNNLQLISEEFDIAFELLEQLDNEFKGNIIAALSARFCDLKIEQFFNSLSEKLKNEFLFVITADHGFPSYENPPRPFTYNQTYTEAFHIPAIIYDSSLRNNITVNNLTSNMDIVNIMQDLSFNSNSASKISFVNRDYILCEYGGPGCPVISEKPIWYTLIDKDYCISAECSLNNEFKYSCIKEIYNIRKDPEQKINIVKKLKKSELINKYIDIFRQRHTILQKKYAGDKFYENLLNKIDKERRDEN